MKQLARVYSAELEGVKAKLIEIEVDLNVGLHAFNIVGLADKALNEARERVNSALKNAGTKPPNRENRKITVNLAPADVKKTGSQYDLAIAIGYLVATRQIKEFDAAGKLFAGELALDGRLRPINGALNIAEMAEKAGFAQLFVPAQNADEAAVISGIDVMPLESLQDAIAILEESKTLAPWIREARHVDVPASPDFSEIKSQENAKRAATIAAAGGHNLLMVGPPGVGKSLLAQAMVGILPRLTLEEAIEVTKIYSATGLGTGKLAALRPFRSPHHTASVAAIVGGGSDPKPGEISLAHRGVLFLDELPEFPRNILEGLRQPLEAGVVHVSRAKGSLAFPAVFTLVGAMNPCPCGFHGDEERECQCGAYDVIRYQRKISGPLLDRIDLQIRVPRVAVEELRRVSPTERISARVRERVEKARAMQAKRLGKFKIHMNAEASAKRIEETANLEKGAEQFLDTLSSKELSPRGYYRLLKTARTIADLEASESVSHDHLAEAYSYRIREEL